MMGQKWSTQNLVVGHKMQPGRINNWSSYLMFLQTEAPYHLSGFLGATLCKENPLI